MSKFVTKFKFTEIEYADDHKDGEEILSHQCNNPDCLCNAKGDEPTSS